MTNNLLSETTTDVMTQVITDVITSIPVDSLFTKEDWLTLPLPPTDNNCRLPRVVKGKANMFPSKAYTEWKQLAELEWQVFLSSAIINNRKDIRHQLTLVRCRSLATQADDEITPYLLPLYRPDIRNQYCFDYRVYKDSDRTDNMNRGKPLQDFFHGKLYHDDRHVKLNLLLPVSIDKANPRIEICLCPTIYHS